MRRRGVMLALPAMAMAGCQANPPGTVGRFDPDEWVYWPGQAPADPPGPWGVLTAAEREQFINAWQGLDPGARAAVSDAWTRLSDDQQARAVQSMRRRAAAGTLEPSVPADIAQEAGPTPRLNDYDSFGGGQFRRGGKGLLP
jgi:hypothetical protein